jgi:hypothetical protein
MPVECDRDMAIAHYFAQQEILICALQFTILLIGGRKFVRGRKI